MLYILKEYFQRVVVEPRQLSSLLCDELAGWDGEVAGRSKREGIYVHIWLYIYMYTYMYTYDCVHNVHIDFVVQQKLTQNCETTIAQ